MTRGMVPVVIEQSGSGERVYDIYSRLMKDRIIMLDGEVEDEMADAIVAQLLFLSNESEKDIDIYINSPGGSITAGLAIYDTMKFIDCDIRTICIGQAASMGALLLGGGTKGKRYSLPNSRIMIHQVSGGAVGQSKDVQNQLKEMSRLEDICFSIWAEESGRTLEQIRTDTDRDKFMSAQEALEFGLIDKILIKKPK